MGAGEGEGGWVSGCGDWGLLSAALALNVRLSASVFEPDFGLLDLPSF